MIKLRFPILAAAILCAAFITKPSLAIEDCYSTPLAYAIDGALWEPCWIFRWKHRCWRRN